MLLLLIQLRQRLPPLAATVGQYLSGLQEHLDTLAMIKTWNGNLNMRNIGHRRNIVQYNPPGGLSRVRFYLAELLANVRSRNGELYV